VTTEQEQAAADAAKAAADAQGVADAKAAEEAKAAEDAAKAAAGASAEADKDGQIARLEAAVKDANREAEKRRKRLNELEALETARQQAEMTETERLKAELEAARADKATAEANARDMLIRAAFVAEAAKAGVAHPEDVYLLADRSAVDVNDIGAVEGVAEAVKALVDAGRVPLLGRQIAPKLDGGAGGTERSDGKAVKLTGDELEMARRMGIKPEKYAAQKAALAQEASA